jgi:hypothetical protein
MHAMSPLWPAWKPLNLILPQPAKTSKLTPLKIPSRDGDCARIALWVMVFVQDSRDWECPALASLVAIADRDSHSQGTSNARHVATLAGLKASRTDHTTFNENHKTASGQISAAFT